MTGRDASPWWIPLAAAAGGTLVQCLGRTWRIDRSALETGERYLSAGGGCILAFWHSRMMPLVYTHRGRGIAVLVSRHRDGELIARILHRLGYVTARGSSTRGGEGGALEMLRYARAGRLLGITPDGPRGPSERVKSGVVYLASRTGLPVLPLAAAAAHAHVFRSWDRFRLPHPMARIVIAYGDPVKVPSELDPTLAETYRLRIEAAIRTLTEDVSRRAGEHS